MSRPQHIVCSSCSFQLRIKLLAYPLVSLYIFLLIYPCTNSTILTHLDDVVNPDDPIPNLRNPYDPLSDPTDADPRHYPDSPVLLHAPPGHAPGPEVPSSSYEQIPEVVIDAMTQIRGHGNIVSMPRFNTGAIGGIVGDLLRGRGAGNDRLEPGQTDQGPAATPFDLNVNIGINCGAVVAGDGNMVGMPVSAVGNFVLDARAAARRAQAQARNQAQTQDAQQASSSPQQGEREGTPQEDRERDPSVGLTTPTKRKAEDEGNGDQEREDKRERPS